MKNLVAWALALMLSKAPLSIADAPGAFPGYEESQAQRLERYQGIAEAVVAVGKDRRTVAKLLAVSFHESSWARDADIGPCYRGKDGKSMRCDSGRAACQMQVRVDVHKQWTAEELFGDRRKCFTAGLEILKKSEHACVTLGPEYAFDSYASGSCVDGHELLSKAHVRGLELFHLSERFRAWEPAAVLVSFGGSSS